MLDFVVSEVAFESKYSFWLCKSLSLFSLLFKAHEIEIGLREDGVIGEVRGRIAEGGEKGEPELSFAASGIR